MLIFLLTAAVIALIVSGKQLLNLLQHIPQRNEDFDAFAVPTRHSQV